MNDIMFRAWVKAQMVKQSAKDKAESVKNHLLEENGGADTIIIAVIIILVVVVLGFVFKDYIISWFNSLTGDVDDALDSGNNFSGVNKPNAGS